MYLTDHSLTDPIVEHVALFLPYPHPSLGCPVENLQVFDVFI